MQKEKKKIVFFISSTGGHLQELLGLASIFENYNYQLITEKTPSNKNLVITYKKRCHYLIYGTKKNFIPYIFVFSFNILKSLFLLLIYHPKAIVTTGTHTAVPMCFWAKLFRIKVVYIETKASFVELSVTGKLLLKVADYFIVQHSLLKNKYTTTILCEV